MDTILNFLLKSNSFARSLTILALGIPFGFPSLATAAGGPPPAPKEESADDGNGEEAKAEEASKEEKAIFVIEPLKTYDPEVVGEEVMNYLQSGTAEWEGGDYEFAEKYFAAALGVPVDVPEKEEVLTAMASLYTRDGFLPKAAATLERLASEYPTSRRLPDVYMELGNLYRKMGALELAISKYYMVMNSSLNVSFDQVESYRALTLKAKLEIAETHAERDQFHESFRLYQSLFRLDLRPEERMLVHYHVCYLLFEIGKFQQAVTQLKLFLEQYPDVPNASEIRYLLAKSYEKLNRKPEALREVIDILQRQSSPDTADPEIADYWKQRTGNELANEFYQTGDFRSALTIYQHLAKYNDAPSWRWPAIHQIGLCYERLGLPEKAILSYREIVNPSDGVVLTDEELGSSLVSLREMAKWRLDHLEWEDDLIARLHFLKTQ